MTQMGTSVPIKSGGQCADGSPHTSTLTIGTAHGRAVYVCSKCFRIWG